MQQNKTKDNFCVLEFHGFKDNNNTFIIKELSIVSKDMRYVSLFRSPYDRSRVNDTRTVSWLENNFHKIKWEEGYIDFDITLIQNMIESYETVYTCGIEKRKYLSFIHGNVVDINSCFGKLNKSSDYKNPYINVRCCIAQHNTPNVHCAFKSASINYRRILKQLKDSNDIGKLKDFNDIEKPKDSNDIGKE